MEEQKANLEATKKLREQRDTVRARLATTAASPGNVRCVAPTCGGLGLAAVSTALRQSSAGTTLNAKEPATLDDLKALEEELKAKADALNALSEQRQLQLQIYMDRYPEPEVTGRGEYLVELRGFEPLTPRLPALCSPN